jgi:cyclic pyranopterin phosphate synthase
MARRAKRARAARPTHLDRRGHAHMVDVADKAATKRRAEAIALVSTTSAVARAILDGTAPKGDVAAVARIAAIQATKKTSELVPLCHPLALSHVSADVDVTVKGRAGTVRVAVVAECVGPTGVEMEAMCGASIGALAVYDMIKGMDRGAAVARVELVSKSGGRSGDWRRT